MTLMQFCQIPSRAELERMCYITKPHAVTASLLKNKELGREGGITGLLEVTVIGGCLMERDASRKPFGFAMDVLLL